MIDDRFVILGPFIAFLGSLSYLVDTIKGKIKPNKISYFIWALAPLIAFFAQIKEGVGLSSLMTFTAGFFPLTIFVASFFNKKAEWRLTRFDLICGLLSLAGLFLWLITKEGAVAIAFSILADGLAALPTLKKAFSYPETESGFAYLTGAVNAFLTVLTLKTWDLTNAGYPIYILTLCLLTYVLVQFKLGLSLKKLFLKTSS